MIIRLAGFEFEISPDERLKAADHAAAKRLSEGPLTDGGVVRSFGLPPWRLILEDMAPNAPASSGGEPIPAAVSCDGDIVSVIHRDFSIEIDCVKGTARLSRWENYPGGLEVALRVSLACRLPLSSGLPLHSAAISADGEGIVFFGPSGAGKSTISGLSPFSVLSDELVALARFERFEVSGSGIWGTLNRPEAPQGYVPLRALVELEKGKAYSLTRLSGRESLLRLMGVVMMPASAALWRGAMPVLASLIESVPVFRMAWNPESPPWDELRQDLDAAGAFAMQSARA